MTVTSQDMVFLGIGGAMLVVVVLCMVLIHYWTERSETLGYVKNKFAGAPIIIAAHQAFFRGFERRWDGQWRGVGILVLTEEVLYFRPWSSHLDITVPVGRIEKVAANGDLSKWSLWHTQLQVSYVGIDDQARVATWLVGNTDEWVSDLKSVRERKVVP